MPDVVIIGGGLQGCAIALFLARAHKQVTIVESSIAGRHASGVNAGGLRLLMRDLREYPLSVRAMEHWANLDRILGQRASDECELRLGSSQIALATDKAEMNWVQMRAAEMTALGYQNEEPLDAAQVRKLLPGVSSSALGGLISRMDGHANPANTTRAFQAAAREAGVTIIEGVKVEGLSQRSSGSWTVVARGMQLDCECVVNCAGAWGAEVAAGVDETLPLRVLALTMMVTTRVKPFIDPVVIGIDKPLSFKQSAVGSLVIGGGISGMPRPNLGASFTIMDRMATSASAVVAAFPMLAGVPVIRTWTGLEGITPDGIPYIGPSVHAEGFWHVFGFCGHGFQLAPAVGEFVARSIIDGRVDTLLTPFATNRFSASRTKPMEAA